MKFRTKQEVMDLYNEVQKNGGYYRIGNKTHKWYILQQYSYHFDTTPRLVKYTKNTTNVLDALTKDEIIDFCWVLNTYKEV